MTPMENAIVYHSFSLFACRNSMECTTYLRIFPPQNREDSHLRWIWINSRRVWRGIICWKFRFGIEGISAMVGVYA